MTISRGVDTALCMKIGTVTIPLFAVMAALPRAIRAAAKAAADDRDADSPGGEKVLASEVAEVVAVFLAKLGEEILPVVMRANGH